MSAATFEDFWGSSDAGPLQQFSRARAKALARMAWDASERNSEQLYVQMIAGRDKDNATLRAVIQQYLDYYAGEKRLRLGTGFAFQWYDIAREAIVSLSKPDNHRRCGCPGHGPLGCDARVDDQGRCERCYSGKCQRTAKQKGT